MIPPPSRRAPLALLLLALTGGTAAADEAAWAALREGGIALFRHANAPGTGDPPGMRLGDCRTQRNLDEAGRAQAQRIGEAFRARGVAVGAVLSSAWCRAVDTAELAFPGRVRREPAFDSFFDQRGRRDAQTADARRALQEWRGPGALVVVTHQVNVTALTGVFPASGEAVVLKPGPDGFKAVGRIRP
jgi:phosphohistidine phosphatase SixA